MAALCLARRRRQADFRAGSRESRLSGTAYCTPPGAAPARERRRRGLCGGTRRRRGGLASRPAPFRASAFPCAGGRLRPGGRRGGGCRDRKSTRLNSTPPSFPTRRSSGLSPSARRACIPPSSFSSFCFSLRRRATSPRRSAWRRLPRSEEHTAELHSPLFPYTTLFRSLAVGEAGLHPAQLLFELLLFLAQAGDFAPEVGVAEAA